MRGASVAKIPPPAATAPAPAVAEFTIGLMLTLLRSVQLSNMEMHKGKWHRHFGRRLSEVTIGIIGVGRVGTGVLQHLKGFGSPIILVNDTLPNKKLDQYFNIEWDEKEQIYQEADFISLHTPLTILTKNMIKKLYIIFIIKTI